MLCSFYETRKPLVPHLFSTFSETAARHKFLFARKDLIFCLSASLAVRHAPQEEPNPSPLTPSLPGCPAGAARNIAVKLTQPNPQSNERRRCHIPLPCEQQARMPRMTRLECGIQRGLPSGFIKPTPQQPHPVNPD